MQWVKGPGEVGGMSDLHMFKQVLHTRRKRENREKMRKDDLNGKEGESVEASSDEEAISVV